MLRKVLPAILLVIAAAVANAEKISGFVSGTPKGKTIIVGAKGGPYTVDASKATVTLNGKFFSISKLTGGSQVTVEGTLKGKSMVAKSVKIGSLKGAPKTTGTKPKTNAPAAKPTSTKPMATKPSTTKVVKTTKASKPATSTKSTATKTTTTKKPTSTKTTKTKKDEKAKTTTGH